MSNASSNTSKTSKTSKPEVKPDLAIARKVSECAEKVNGTEYQLVTVIAAAMTRKTNRLTVAQVRASIVAGLEGGKKLANIKPDYAQDFPLAVELFRLGGYDSIPLSELFGLCKDLRNQEVDGKTLKTEGAFKAAAAAKADGKTLADLRKATPKKQVKTNGSRSGKVSTVTLDSVLGEVLAYLDASGIDSVDGAQSLLISTIVERLEGLSVK